ncbi:hypothetical protein KESI111651_10070 [Kerstersia similis]
MPYSFPYPWIVGDGTFLNLSNLERGGLVAGHYLPEVPPRAEYEITALDKSLLHALENINRWIKDNLPHVEASRQTYDTHPR